MANIHQAAIQGDTRLLQQLLHNNPAVVDSQMMVTDATPLHLACAEGHMDAARVLLQYHANVNARDKDGETPLHKTMDFVKGSFFRALFGARRSVELASFLLESGVSIEARNSNGETALHKAATLGRKDLVELFLTNGADPNSRNNKGNTPLRSALRHKQQQVVELLRKHGGRETG